VGDLDAVIPLFFLSLRYSGDTEIESKIPTHALRRRSRQPYKEVKLPERKTHLPSSKNRKGKIKLTSTLFHRSLPGSQLKNATPLSRSITTSSQFRI
jgi:hypothetical protein